MNLFNMDQLLIQECNTEKAACADLVRGASCPDEAKKDAKKNECSGASCFLYERLKFCELKRLLFGLRVINQKSPWCISRWWKSRKTRKNRSICWGTDAAAWRDLPSWAPICPCGKRQNQRDPNSIAIHSWIVPSCFRSKVPKIHSSLLKSSDNKSAQREWFYLFATAERFGVRPHPCSLTDATDEKQYF